MSDHDHGTDPTYNITPQIMILPASGMAAAQTDVAARWWLDTPAQILADYNEWCRRPALADDAIVAAYLLSDLDADADAWDIAFGRCQVDTNGVLVITFAGAPADLLLDDRAGGVRIEWHAAAEPEGLDHADDHADRARDDREEDWRNDPGIPQPGM